MYIRGGGRCARVCVFVFVCGGGGGGDIKWIRGHPQNLEHKYKNGRILFSS